MNNIEDVILVASIALTVSNFLINTCRAHKAIELSKEGLSIVSKDEPIKENELYKHLNKDIYLTLLRAYSLINDYKNTINCPRKYLQIYQQYGERLEECRQNIKLATSYFRQSKYVEAKELFEKALLISTEIGDKSGEALCYGNLGTVYQAVGVYEKAKQYQEKALAMTKQFGDRNAEVSLYGNLGNLFQSVGEYQKAKEYLEEAIAISREIDDKKGEALSYGNLGNVFQSVGEYQKAKEYYENALAISKEIGDREGEGADYGNLGTLFSSVGEYQKAKEYQEKALAISVEIGDKKGEASSYGNLGNVFSLVGEYQKAREYHEKAVAITKGSGDKKGEGAHYGNLGTVFQSVGEYQKAKEYYENALAISQEIGDREGEGADCGNLGNLLYLLGEYQEAKEYLEKALAISVEIGYRKGEACFYGNLGTVFQSVGEYQKAKEYHGHALAISKEIDDREGEASCYGKIGAVFRLVGEYQKAKEYYENAFAIQKEIGDKKGEASSFGNLGNVFQSVGNYQNAMKYHENALAIRKEIGEREGEATSYGNLGTVFQSIGEYQKVEEYYENALAIQKEIGDKSGEATSYGNLGNVFQSLGEYQKAKEFYENALAFKKEIGDKNGEAISYGNLGTVFQSLGDYKKAREYHEKALVISKEIGDRVGEASIYGNLGTIFQFLGDYAEAEEYHKRGLAISEQIGDIEKQFDFLCKLASVKLSEGKIHETLSYFALGIDKCEHLRGFLGENDQFKISFSHLNTHPYRVLTLLFCYAGNPDGALYVSELGRARGLADLMSAQYFEENQILVNPQLRVAIESVMDRERNCTCLYFSYFCDNIFLWILKASRVLHFRKVNGREVLVREGLVEDLDEYFAKESFRGFGISPGEHCEDQSSKNIQREPKPAEKYCPLVSRTGTENDKENHGVKMTLSLCYKLIIAPVVELIDDPEILIVPERSLYNIPFAALPDDTGKCLSETFRIRVVPSLTTLKLIQDSPADYHSPAGALIVGNPDVGMVRYKRRLKNISRLPYAENEAIMVGGKLGVEPLLGKQATKQAVLQAINSVGLIHFAAHGFEEEGEIALAPNFATPNKIPKEEDYLLTMSDISKVRLRAKLVVLSCCHSARGHIKAEGVVGIARAFLGSGACSVLVALWRVQDSATEQFMRRFYEHLVGGNSASESLHEAMKWMRCNGYSDVRQWAPFMLIGDNVTFHFGKNLKDEVKTRSEQS